MMRMITEMMVMTGDVPITIMIAVFVVATTAVCDHHHHHHHASTEDAAESKTRNNATISSQIPTKQNK
jgi:cell division protein FtsL